MTTKEKVISPEEAMAHLSTVSSEPETNVLPPNDNLVTLPGGYLTQDGQVLTTAEVRELNGADEEAIYRATNLGKALGVILKRGLVSVGNFPATPEVLNNLLAGDREAILVGIRSVTFGDEVELKAVCGSCGSANEFKMSLADDVKTVSLDEPMVRSWEVELKKGGTAVVKYPTGKLQSELFEISSEKTLAELNTILIGGCLVSINGMPTTGTAAAQRLGVMDRETLLESILTKNPGPRLGEVSNVCKSCGEKVDTPINMTGLFRL